MQREAFVQNVVLFEQNHENQIHKLPMKQTARNNQNHSQPSRSRDRRVEPCSITISGEESTLIGDFSSCASTRLSSS